MITTSSPATDTSATAVPATDGTETEANLAAAPWNNMGGAGVEGMQRNFPPRYEQPEPKKQRNLLTYILIVAVIVLAIVCIALVVTTSGVLNSSSNDNTDSITGIQTLPPDTQAVYVEEEPETKPVIRTELQEELPVENEEIQPEAQPSEAQPVTQPEESESAAPVSEESGAAATE